MTMSTAFYWQAVNRALDEELTRDPRVVLFGEDVALPGGVFGVTRRLREKHGERRVFDMPISESAFTGAAIGAAMTGLRPVVELMFMDFSLVAADQIINHAAKVRYMSQGGYAAPLVIRAQQGVSPGSSAQHTQSFEHLFTGIPGLRVVAAATPWDAYGMLKAAIRSDDPVLFLEHRMLYGTRGEMPENEHLEPLTSARVRREGTDVTLLGWLRSVEWIESIAQRLDERGVSAEVIDLRSLSPIDYDTIARSVAKTGRAVIVHEAIREGGLGGEIAATLHADHAAHLRAPVARYGAEFTPMASAVPLQEATQPDLDAIVEDVVRAVAADRSVPLS
ncbi:alpha-ketoacid dehydrogenase subunit beta [Microbacterium sp. RD1]|uniref:alpha-ketoacid dehydrogenase subunit beta n=1 Tax=Microbacterium sp. RD1 TaxID=3457313 RepID=UPI003FA54DAE